MLNSKLFLFVFSLMLFSAQPSMAAPIKILPIGDSISLSGTGYGDSYRKNLLDSLNQNYDVEFVGSVDETVRATPVSDPFVEAVDGFRADQMNTYIDGSGYLSTLSNTADVALIHLGTNDIIQAQTDASTKADIENIIAKLQTRNPAMDILVAKIIPLNGNGASDEAALLNALLDGTWSATVTIPSKVKVVDLNSGMIVDGSGTDDYQGADTIHPNDGGDAKMASKWYSELVTLDVIQASATSSGLPIQDVELTLWLDASDVDANDIEDTVATNTSITSWSDKSTQSNDVSQVATTTAPIQTTNATGINGKPIVNFASSGLETAATGQITADSSYTKFVVFKFNTVGNNNLIASNPYRTTLWGETGTLNLNHSTGSYPGDITSTSNVSLGDVHIGTARYGIPDGADNILKLDKVLQGSGTTVRNHSATKVSIGSIAAGFYLDGSIAEALVYDRALTDAEITLVEDYLFTKWFVGDPDAGESSVDVAGSPAPVVANGSSSKTIVVEVLDANDNPISGATVSLTQGAGSSTIGSVTDNNDGTYDFTVSSTTAEVVTYTATADGVTITDTADVTFIADDADAGTSSVDVSPASVVADGTTATVTVTVNDANSNPISGATVTLAQGAGSSTIGAVTDNSNGTYTFTVSSTTAEAVTYTATADSVEITDTAVVTFTTGAANAGTSSVDVSSASVVADGTTATVTVTVNDANSNPISGATVTLAQGAGSSTIGAVTDNSDGTYTFTVSSTTAEAVTYTATADSVEITDTADVTFIADDADSGNSDVTVTSNNSDIANGTDSFTLEATVLDTNGNTVPNETVTFVQPANTTLSALTCNTAANGTCSVTVTSTVAGIYSSQVSIADGNLDNSPAGFTFIAGPAAAGTSTVAASPTSVPADDTSSTITVTVNDANSNPISGATVSLAQGAGSSTIGSVTDNNDGTYTFNVNSTTGETVTYTATADGVVITQTANVDFTKLDQTIGAITPTTAKTFGDADFTVGATATSGLTVSYGSSTPTVCTATTAGLVTITGAGTCTVTADQIGDSQYNAATQVTADITVNAADQTISAITPATAKTFGDADFTVTATATSGLTVSFGTSTPAVCTVTTAGVVSIVGTGTCTVTADQAGDTNYNPAPQVTANITVDKGDQTITFTPPTNKTFGDDPFTISATATSGLPVTVFGSNTTSICTISGSTVTLLSAGACELTADQAGDSNYNAAPQVSANVTGGAANQTISFNPPATVTFGDAPFALTATATSGLTVSYSSTTTSVCEIKGTNVDILAAGTCTITANQGGNANYNAAAPVTKDIIISENSALNAVIEDIAGNSDGTPATAAQINSIDGVSGAVAGTDYSVALAAGTFANPNLPTAAEILTVVNAENARVVALNAAIAAIAEDIAGNADGTPATAAEINLVIEAVSALTGVDYTAALAAGTYADPSNPTAAEIKAVIDTENASNSIIETALAAVVEDIAGNADGTGVTAAQLNLIPGISGAVGGRDYATALADATFVDPSNPTTAEIQAVVDDVNAKAPRSGGGAFSLNWLLLLGLIALLRRRTLRA